MDLDFFSKLTDYPFISNGTFYDSPSLKQNKTCSEKCKEKDCLDLFEQNESSKYLCSKSYDNYLLIIENFKVVINGLILETNNSIPSGRKEVRKQWIIAEKELDLFVSRIELIEENIKRQVLESTERNFSIFHDFKTSMSIFFNCTQDIISKLPGDTFEEKLEHGEKQHRDLYNSLELITSQLRMIDVILNPKSIEFGVKKRVNLYRLFEKIKILFSHLSDKKQAINVNIESESYVDDCLCYESIEFIPLILLDNALKYSVKDSNIEIKFEQNHRTLKVIVKNIGPLVSDENTEKIFSKFFRDESAQNFSKEGIGMGLWIAQQILKSHNSKLHYFKDPKEKRAIGLNIFEFDIQTVY